MAKIRSYSSTQTEASSRGIVSGETGASSASYTADAWRSAGKALDAGADAMARSEISDLDASFAKAREDWTLNLNEQVRTGKIDAEKVDADYQKYMDNLSSMANTPRAQDYYQRQSERLRGTILRTATIGQAQIASEKAVANYQTALNSNTNTLSMNPNQFDDIYAGSVETLNAQVASGALSFEQGEKLKKATSGDLAKASIRGWAELDPNTADKKLADGTYAQYLDNDSITQMKGYVNTVRSAKRIEDERSLAAQEKAKKLQSDAWQTSNVSKLANLSLKTQDILSSPMSADDKIRWMKLAKDATKDAATETDPRVFNDLVRRATLPDSDPNKIRSMADLAPYTGGRGLDLNAAQQINSFIQKLPEGEAATDNRKRLLDYATADLVKKNPLTGVSDPDGEQNMAKFVVSLQNEEAKMRKEKKDVTLLYDPTSKEYFGNKVSKYRLSPQEVMAKQAGRMQSQPPPAAFDDFTQSPGPDQKPPPKNNKVRQPGESAAAFLKRMKEG